MKTFTLFLLSGLAFAAQAGIDWSSAKVEVGASGVVVKSAAGELLCRLYAQPSRKGAGADFAAHAGADGFAFDLAKAFAAGAKSVQLHTAAVPADGFTDADVEFAAELSAAGGGKLAEVEVLGACGMPTGGKSTVYLNAPRNKVIATHVEPVVPGRQTYALKAIVPDGATTLATVLKFTSAGSAPVVYHGARIARATAAMRPKAENKVLFHATFDGTLLPEMHGGKAQPIVTNALAFVEGRRGQAVRFDRARASRLVYSAVGNVNPERGTMTCWMRHDLPVDKDQSLFMIRPKHGMKPGDGSVLVTWRKYGVTGIVRWDRGDYARTGRQWGPQACPFPTNGWVQVAVTWDDAGVKLYANGRPFGFKKISDNTCPLNDALFEPPALRFAENWPQAIALMMIGCGNDPKSCWNGAIDDVRIWSEPMSREDVSRFYAADAGEAVCDPSALWSKTWRAPKDPPPPNRALAPADAEPGVPTNLELVEDLSPAALAKAGDAARFRAAGPWRIGACDGLDYLEAGRGLNDRYAIRFRVDGTVPLWCFEITYPDNAARAIDLVVQNARDGMGYSLNSGIETGLEHPLTMKNATKKFLFWRSAVFPDAAANGDLALIVMTQTENNPAAISRVRLYAIRDGRIPDTPMRDAAPVGGLRRHSAIWFEDPAIMHDFGTEVRGGVNADPLLMIDRIAAYMRYTGQDMLIYPAVWYAGIISETYQPRPHMPHFMREVCRRFARDGLVFVPSVNQQWFPQIPLAVTRPMLTDGSLLASPISILETGYPNLGGWHHSPTYYNIAHPAVQKALLDELESVCAECRDHASFGGVALDSFNSINVTSWGSLRAGYNDYAIDGFEKATGIRVPVDRKDPMRGRLYARWLLANARDAWIRWRCDVLTDFYRRAAETLRRHRPDLMLYVRCALTWRSKFEMRDDLFDEDVTDHTLRESGIDCAALARLPGVSLALMSMPAYWHDELQKLPAPKERLERVRDLPETEGYQKLIRDSVYPFADFHDSYYESPVGARKGKGRHAGDGRLSGDWLVEKPWRVTSFAASGREALRPYAKALTYGDVFAFGRGGFLLGTCGDEVVTAPFMRAFRALPAVKFADAAGFAHGAVRFRTAVVDGTRWFYAVNTGFEPAEVTFPLPEGTVDAVTGRPVARKLRLDSYELRALKAVRPH